MMKGIKLKTSIQMVLIIIKIRSICSDGSSDYKCFVMITLFICTIYALFI